MSTQTRKLQAAFELLSVICDEVSDAMPVRQVLAFVSVAIRSTTDGEADLRDIAKDIKAVSAVASRDLLALGIRARNGEAGHDLVAVKQDFKDLRRRPYVLTKKGQALVNKLLEAV
jgi:DNA-binding MarR family transcriptional regulator